MEKNPQTEWTLLSMLVNKNVKFNTKSVHNTRYQHIVKLITGMDLHKPNRIYLISSKELKITENQVVLRSHRQFNGKVVPNLVDIVNLALKEWQISASKQIMFLLNLNRLQIWERVINKLSNKTPILLPMHNRTNQVHQITDLDNVLNLAQTLDQHLESVR